MKDTSALHDVGHSLGLWLFDDTTPWFEFVLHTVLLAAPLALAVVLASWCLPALSRLVRRGRGGDRTDRDDTGSAEAVGRVFGYILGHTRRSQALLLGAAAISLPLIYAGLELPKLIINGAISSGHFPAEVIGQPLSQTGYLFLLCGLYLAVILINGTLKYAINLRKGLVAETLLRRLRLTIYRRWRRGAARGERSEVIPMLVQEVEPIGGFAGDAFVLPLFQGGTFLTILAFMFVQDPVLGAAAVTLLPVQLLLIPRLQRRINDLARSRAREMRGLGGAIGREIAAEGAGAAETRRQVAETLRRVAAIRFEIYRKKFFMKGLNNFITQLTPFFFYTVGGYLVIEGRLSFGALVAVLAAHKDFSAPLKELLKYYQTMEDARVRFAEVRRFLSATAPRPTLPEAGARAPRPEPPGCAPLRPVPAAPRALAAAASRVAAIPNQGRLGRCAPHGHLT